MKTKINQSWEIILPILSLSLFVLGWSILAMMDGTQIPTITETFEKFISILTSPLSGATLLGHIWASLQRVLIAFSLVIIVGIFLGVGFGWSKTFDSLVHPIFELLRFIPPIAWIPLIILWFGIGELPKMIIVFIGSVTPVVLNTYSGIKEIDPLTINSGKILGANNRQLLFEVALPASIPAILAGIKTALSSGWMCVVAAEMIVAREGVGFLIVRGQESGDTALIIVCMLTIGIVNSLLSFLLNKLEEVATPWRTEKTK